MRCRLWQEHGSHNMHMAPSTTSAIPSDPFAYHKLASHTFPINYKIVFWLASLSRRTTCSRSFPHTQSPAAPRHCLWIAFCTPLLVRIIRPTRRERNYTIRTIHLLAMCVSVLCARSVWLGQRKNRQIIAEISRSSSQRAPRMDGANVFASHITPGSDPKKLKWKWQAHCHYMQTPFVQRLKQIPNHTNTRAAAIRRQYNVCLCEVHAWHPEWIHPISHLCHWTSPQHLPPTRPPPRPPIPIPLYGPLPFVLYRWTSSRCGQ